MDASSPANTASNTVNTDPEKESLKSQLERTLQELQESKQAIAVFYKDEFSYYENRSWKNNTQNTAPKPKNKFTMPKHNYQEKQKEYRIFSLS